MKKKLFILFLVIMLLVVPILTACSTNTASDSTSQSVSTAASENKEEQVQSKNENPQKNSLGVLSWIRDDIFSAFMYGVDQFNSRDDVTCEIQVERTPSDSAKVKLATLMAANEVPDIFMPLAYGQLKPFVDSGKVYALDEGFANHPGWEERFMPGLLQYLSFNDSTYAVPITQAPVFLYYNKEIFDKYNLKPPATESELKNVVKVLVENDILPFSFGDKDGWEGMLHFELVVHRIGGMEPYEKLLKGEGDFLDESFIKATGFMSELIEMKALPEGFLSIDYEEMKSTFREGKAAMLVTLSDALTTLIADDSKVKGKVGIAKYPTFDNGKGSVNCFLSQPHVNLAISQKCEYKEDAVKFLETFSREDVQMKFFTSGTLIATKLQIEDVQGVDPVMIEAANQLSEADGVMVAYDVALGQLVGGEINNTIQSVLAGTDPQQAFGQFQEFYDANFDQD